MKAPENKQYTINEIFSSYQGEGVRTGTKNIFVRFSGCNMQCSLKPGPLSPGGFDCDTEFVSGRKLNLAQIYEFIQEIDPVCKSIIFTGGEPALQVDKNIIDFFHDHGYYLAIETNGSISLVEGIDWITVSPKVAEHAIRQKTASEVKYVRGYGQGIPKTVVEADHYLISPAFEGNELDKKTFDWCEKLAEENPQWKISTQQHKAWKIR